MNVSVYGANVRRTFGSSEASLIHRIC